jgi:hypothetical protein
MSEGAVEAPSEPPPITGCAGDAGARTAALPVRGAYRSTFSSAIARRAVMLKRPS